MGLFTSKSEKERLRQEALSQTQKKQEEKQRKEAALAISGQASLKKLRESSPQFYRELFNSFETTLGLAKQPNLKDELDGYEKMATSLRLVKDGWLRVDLNLLTSTQALEMAWIVEEAIPSAISKFSRRTVSTSSSWAAWGGGSYSWSEPDSKTPGGIFIQVLEKLERIHLAHKTGATIPETVNIDQSIVLFPVYNVDDNDVQSTLSRLSKLWKQAASKKNTVEDEYFLEQMVSKYLPEAWELFDTFSNAPEESRNMAKSILMEQFHLLETHMLHILKTYMNQNLEAMKSQVGFLKAKVEQPEVNPQLALSSSVQKELEASV